MFVMIIKNTCTNKIMATIITFSPKPKLLFHRYGSRFLRIFIFLHHSFFVSMVCGLSRTYARFTMASAICRKAVSTLLASLADVSQNEALSELAYSFPTAAATSFFSVRSLLFPIIQIGIPGSVNFWISLCQSSISLKVSCA